MKNTYSHKYSRSTDAKDDKIKIFHHDIYLGNNNTNWKYIDTNFLLYRIYLQKLTITNFIISTPSSTRS